MVDVLIALLPVVATSVFVFRGFAVFQIAVCLAASGYEDIQSTVNAISQPPPMNAYKMTSPLTPKGKFIFGPGTGIIIMVLRLFSGYPEGVMFAVLFMNALTPLINRWTIPKPFGGKQS